MRRGHIPDHLVGWYFSVSMSCDRKQLASLVFSSSKLFNFSSLGQAVISAALGSNGEGIFKHVFPGVPWSDTPPPTCLSNFQQQTVVGSSDNFEAFLCIHSILCLQLNGIVPGKAVCKTLSDTSAGVLLSHIINIGNITLQLLVNYLRIHLRLLSAVSYIWNLNSVPPPPQCSQCSLSTKVSSWKKVFLSWLCGFYSY